MTSTFWRAIALSILTVGLATLTWISSVPAWTKLGALLPVLAVLVAGTRALLSVRRYHQRSRVFDVKSYGATGDGSTDDTAAIQRAIAAATSAGGGVIYFPPGTFVCGKSILANDGRKPS